MGLFAVVTFFTFCFAHAQNFFPPATVSSDGRLASETVGYVNHFNESISKDCNRHRSPADEGCDIVRNRAAEFSPALTTTQDFKRLIAQSGGMDKFLAKYGLNPPSSEQIKGPNADLPMGVSYSADKSHVHINCFFCHGSTVNGRAFEGGANSNLRLAELQNALKKPDIAEYIAYRLAVGEAGIPGYPGATNALEMSFFATAIHSSKTGNVSGYNIVKEVLKGVVSHRLPTPIFASPWWELAPGLREDSVYAMGGANQSFGHIVQLAMYGKATAQEIRDKAPMFEKILACVRSIRPPPNPLPVNRELAAKGMSLYTGNRAKDSTCNCAVCHGQMWRGQYLYPEKVIRGSFLKTDPTEIDRLKNPEEMKHHMAVLNQIDPNAQQTNLNVYGDLGYVAPPLVAMFTKTALLHNHSVPTLKDLLCKSEGDRPTRWTRNSSSNVFTPENVNYNPKKGDDAVFNSSDHGFGNKGHDFCRDLKNNPESCNAVIEYLKTL